MKNPLIWIAVFIAVSFFPAVSFATVYTVNANTWSNTGVGATGDLLYCINQANADAAPGPHTIRFAAGITGSIPFTAISVGNPTQQIIIDGETATGWSCGNPVVVMDQNGGWNDNTLTLQGAGVIIRSLIFQGAKISITQGSSELYGCWFNLDATGNAASAENQVQATNFMTISGGINHIIGSNDCNCNVFSMNVANMWNDFIYITGGDGTSFNGNYFGTDRTGLNLLSNYNTGIGIIRINGTVTDLQINNNILSCAQGGTGRAIVINVSAPIDVTGLTINGNKIGLDANGNVSAGFGNTNGAIAIMGPYGNITGSNIIISDNDIGSNGISTCDIYSNGIFIDANFTNVTISGNYLGTTRTTYANAGNGLTGILIVNAIDQLTIANNVIGFNGSGCVNSHGGEITNCTNVTFSGNYIGVSPGSTDIGNNTSGFVFASCSNVTITDNYIGNNRGTRNLANGGLVLNGGNDFIIQNNRIGIAPDGSACGQQNIGGNGRGGNGIAIQDALRVRIGGTGVNESNIITSSSTNGVNAFSTTAGACDFIEMRYNSIYCNGSKGINLNYGANAANAGLVPPVLTGTPYLNPTPSAQGTKPSDTRVDVFGTSQCAVNCTTTPQGQLYKGEATTYAGGTTGTSWSFTPGGNIFDYITALATGVTGTSNCTVVGIGACRTSEFSTCEDNDLPVEFSGIGAKLNQDGCVLIWWSTASEINNDFFEIMRSQDGEHFEAIGTMKSSGMEGAFYSYTDPVILNGINYYKIKQVDVNETFSFSAVVSVNHSNSSFRVYPVPASDVLIAEGCSNSVLALYDLPGKLLKRISIGDEEYYRLEISELPVGTYVIQKMNSSGHETWKFVKE